MTTTTRKPLRKRTWFRVSAGGAGAVAIIAIAASAGSAGSHPGGAGPAPASSSAPSNAAPGSVRDWWASVGLADMSRVQADADHKDGAALTGDATTALNDVNSEYAANQGWQTDPRAIKFYQDETRTFGFYHAAGQAMQMRQYGTDPAGDLQQGLSASADVAGDLSA
jgi:hypothetical protein